ncbi:MAG: O-antigen ligase family protein [Rhizobiaceae bacterium]|nr:O-antigen ligase family protein [Rhizobiaceae bacterium]
MRAAVSSPAGRRSGRQSAEAEPKALEAPLAWPVKLFIISLAVPWEWAIGPAVVSPSRLVLLLSLPMCLIAWLSGKIGRFQLTDFGVLFFTLWSAIALTINAGSSSAVQSSGILFVETFGAYMLARRYVRSAEVLHSCMIFTAKMVACILPFALFEWITGKNILMMVADMFFNTLQYGNNPKRMGLWRVQSSFAHPIIFGLFSGSIIAFLAGDYLRKPAKGRAPLLLAVMLTAITAMSSAPFAAMLLQLAMVGWNHALRNNAFRWKLLWLFVFAGYLLVEFGSNQTPIEFYISRFTFEAESGWYRLAIWDFGSASVMNNPWFGIGLNDWARPGWMYSDSVDNFWLLTAMRYGLPALIVLVVPVFISWMKIARHTKGTSDVAFVRTCYLICMVAFALVGTTVHFWGAVYLWFFFLVGAGACLLDAPDSQQSEPISALSDRQSRHAERLAREARAGRTREVPKRRFEHPQAR